MQKTKVGVVGYGVIGQRLADGAALQEDMELTGIVDVAPTLSIRALYDSDKPHPLYVVEDSMAKAFEDENIPVQGTLDKMLKEVDIILGEFITKQQKILKKPFIYLVIFKFLMQLRHNLKPFPFGFKLYT